jgi:hypothetical protein
MWKKLAEAWPEAMLAIACFVAWTQPGAVGLRHFEAYQTLIAAQAVCGALAVMAFLKLDLRSLFGMVLILTWIAVAVATILAFLEGTFQQLAPGLVPFVVLVRSVYAVACDPDVSGLKRKRLIFFAWASAACMTLALAVAITIPLPTFGWPQEYETHAALMAACFLYFGTMAALQFLWRPNWTVQFPALHRRSLFRHS